MAKVSDADVIREMIRHEDDLLIGRTNWLMTLQGLLFAAFAIGWNNWWMPLFVALMGIFFAAIFIPYLQLSERAIAKLLAWWDSNKTGYEGPPIMGLGYRDVPVHYWKFMPWDWLPKIFIAAWLVFSFAWVVQHLFKPG